MIPPNFGMFIFQVERLVSNLTSRICTPPILNDSIIPLPFSECENFSLKLNKEREQRAEIMFPAIFGMSTLQVGKLISLTAAI